MKKRDFLKNIAAGTVAIPHFLNGFHLCARNSSPLESTFQPFLSDTDKVLVLIQLNGGNDGLNTIIPLDQYGHYFNARPYINIPENKVLALEGIDHLGLHPRMEGMQQLYNEGKLSIVQNVGYPQPNFSHFRATDIWMSGSASDEVLNTGWLGRYLKYEYPNYPFDFPNPAMPHPLAIEIGYAQSLTMQGPFFGMGVAISDAEGFYELVEGQSTPVPDTPAGDQLAYVRLIARQANHYSDYIKGAYENVTFQPAYPDTHLAAQLKIVAALIAGGLQTRIFQVNIGGFDTHSFQVDLDAHWLGSHGDLLENLSEAITAFQADLAFHGIEDRVLGMTYSEFGRRILANGSHGTDHGAAAPMFLFGANVESGVVGANPILPLQATVNDNIPMQHDFRSVYSSILKDWFCVPESDLGEIMLQYFPTLPLIANSDCISTAVREKNQEAGKKLISNYPNPFVHSTNITFESNGGKTVIQVLNAQGQLVATPFNKICPEGEMTVDWDAEGLPGGIYYGRLQNGPVNQVTAMMKVQ